MVFNPRVYIFDRRWVVVRHLGDAGSSDAAEKNEGVEVFVDFQGFQRLF